MRLLLVFALAGIVALASPAAAMARAKPVKCKAGQVKVKAGKKKARCRSVRAVLPKPRDADPRVSFLKTALNLPVPKAKKARSAKRRTRSLRRGFGRAGKRAYTRMLRVLPKALAKADARAPSRKPLARAAQSNPCGGDGDILGSSTTSEGGVIATTTQTSTGLGTVITFSTGGLAFVIRYFSTQGCDPLDVPKCPTASGAADASDSTLDRVQVDVRQDGRLVSSQRSSVRRATRTHGQTAGDAKLDFVIVDDTVTLNTTANGVTVAGRLTRHTYINMRTERYDPSRSTASYVGAGALQGRDNSGFAALAQSIIAVYRAAESAPDPLGLGGGWATFDIKNTGEYCINGRFNPERRTLRLRKGRSGSFTGQAISKRDGGVASDTRWEKVEEFNGTFSSAGSGQTPSFSYTVTNAGPSDVLSVEYKVTSTAGVARLNWSQDTEVPTINHIRGGFNGSQVFAPGSAPASLLTFAGTLRFDRFGPATAGPSSGLFRFAGGEYTVTASGRDQSGVTACSQTGTQHFTIPGGVGSVSVNGGGPYTYTISVTQPAQPMTITRTGCPPDAAEFNGTTFQSGIFTPFQSAKTYNSNGTAFAGADDQRTGGSGLQWAWSLTGTED